MTCTGSGTSRAHLPVTARFVTQGTHGDVVSLVTHLHAATKAQEKGKAWSGWLQLCALVIFSSMDSSCFCRIIGYDPTPLQGLKYSCKAVSLPPPCPRAIRLYVFYSKILQNKINKNKIKHSCFIYSDR